MVRIVQAESNDCVSVSKFYSGMLLKFVNKVLQVKIVSAAATLHNKQMTRRFYYNISFLFSFIDHPY